MAAASSFMSSYGQPDGVPPEGQGSGGASFTVLLREGLRTLLGGCLAGLLGVLVYFGAVDELAGSCALFFVWVWFFSPEDWNDGPGDWS